MTISVVLADANILFSRTLRDYVLYAADEGAIEVHWSRQILAEMSRNLRENLGLSQDSTARLEQLMNDYIEYALVEIDPGDLAAAGAVAMDAKDRHVLAAALSADADILLTDNAKDFPAQWMAGRGIELLTAGQLLTRLADDFPDMMRVAHEKTVRYSPKSEADILTALERTAGKYAADAIRKVATDSKPPALPCGIIPDARGPRDHHAAITTPQAETWGVTQLPGNTVSCAAQTVCTGQ